MSEGRGPTSAPPAIDYDIYCLHCGYNLRGLSGDPVRCPECGNLNPLGDVEIPADIIARQLKKMETGPARAVAAVLTFAFSAWLLWFSRGEWLKPVVPCSVAAVAWTVLAIRFRDSCLRKPGWFAALITYHFWGLLMIVTTIGAVPCVLWFAITLAQRLYPDESLATFMAATVGMAACAFGIAYWVPWAYRRAKRSMEALQREVAVTLAREVIRKRMANRMWYGPFG